MGFWSWLTGEPASNPNPGNPDGLYFPEAEIWSRAALPAVQASAWAGWPAEWATPSWQGDMRKLVDIAWACLDLNASVLASLPPHLRVSGVESAPRSWMTNPDPEVYASWDEFAGQLFWDYQMGEAFVWCTEQYADGYPKRFRIVPPWLVRVDVARDGYRRYMIGSLDVSGDILHIRYRSTSIDARGTGPLEATGARMATAGVLQRYVGTLAESGGIPHYWLGIDRTLTKAQADDLLDQWVESRKRRLGEPALLSGGTKLNQASYMNAKDMALLELGQWTESRIAVALGVPPFLVALPSGGDSMTYTNTAALFDHHYRASLRPKAHAVMAALSGWALPRGSDISLDAEEYIRPPLDVRATAWVALHGVGAITTEEIRAAERFDGALSASDLGAGKEGDE